MRQVERDELVFDEVEIPPSGEATLRATNPGGRLLRPLRLTLLAQDLWGLHVTGIFVGSEACMAGEGAVSAAVFAESGEDAGIAYPTIAPLIVARVVVRNLGTSPVRVRAKFTGPSVYNGEVG